MNIWNIACAVLIFGLIIFVHEFGHFLTAKSVGIRVNEFSIGMGPLLFSFTKGETQYALRLLPIGGYVNMTGEDEASDDPRAFCNKRPIQRFLVLASGAFMNIVLGFFVMLALVTMQEGIGSTVVGAFEEGATSSAQLQINDEILRVNGTRVHIANEVLFELMKDEDGLVDMQVLRGEERLELTAVPFVLKTDENGMTVLTRDFKVFGYPKTFFGVIRTTYYYTLTITKQIWYSLLQLFSDGFALNQLSGPVGITSAIGEATASGSMLPVLLLLGFITINVGIMNLLPLPALDGGRLFFLLIELVIGRPVPARYEAWIHAAGLAMLMMLIVYVTYHDILRLVQGA